LPRAHITFAFARIACIALVGLGGILPSGCASVPPERVDASDFASSRRLLFEPVDFAYVRRGGAERFPAEAVFGESDGAILLLRFQAELPPQARVLKAFLLLHRAPGVSQGAAPVELRAAPVLDAWDGRSASWARGPRVACRAHRGTVVAPGAGEWIRIDVGDLVRRWRERPGGGRGSGGGYGVAIFASGRVASEPAVAVVLGGAAAPRLELYVE
jgi:hypothetical protein